MAVNLFAIAGFRRKIDHHLQFIVDDRRTPDLRRIGDKGVAGRNQSGCIVTLETAIGRIRLAIFDANVDKTFVTHRQADVGCDLHRGTIAFVELAIAHFNAATFAGILQYEVQHAGYGVRTVLRRGAITKHFDLLQCDRRNHRDVRALRTIGHAIAQPGNDGCTMTALAIDQDQRLIGCHATQLRRPHDRRRITDRLRVDAIGRNNVANQIAEIGSALVDEFVSSNDVYRDHRFGHRARLPASTGGDNFFNFAVLVSIRIGVLRHRLLRKSYRQRCNPQ